MVAGTTSRYRSAHWCDGYVRSLCALAGQEKIDHGVDRAQVVDVDLLLLERKIVGLLVPDRELQDRRRVEITRRGDDVGIAEGPGVAIQRLGQLDNPGADSRLHGVAIQRHG